MKALPLGVTLGLVAGALAYATLTDHGPEAPALAAKAAGGETPRLWVHGRVHGLHPGASKRMRVRIRNRFPDPVRVVGAISAAVGDAGAGCDRENLTVGTARTRRPIGSHDRRLVRLDVQMSAAAPDACQGASFPLRFSARGKRA